MAQYPQNKTEKTADLNSNDFDKRADMKDVTPKVMVKHEKIDPLYYRAFLDSKTGIDSEYSHNTTTWD